MSGQQHAPAALYPRGKDTVPILQEAGWAPGAIWTGGKSRPHRDSIPDRPAHSSIAIPTELSGPGISEKNLKLRILNKNLSFNARLKFMYFFFKVSWTVHHLDSWLKIDQLDVTHFIISPLCIYFAYCWWQCSPFRDKLWVENRGFKSRHTQLFFSYAKRLRPALKPIQPPMKWEPCCLFGAKAAGSSLCTFTSTKSRG